MTDINYEAIGKRIRAYRLKLKLTQAKLAEESGVEPSNISHIERGATKVSLPTLLKLTNILEVSLDDLLYDSLNKSSHISYRAIEELLSDCSDTELKAIVEIIKTTKLILRQ